MRPDSAVQELDLFDPVQRTVVSEIVLDCECVGGVDDLKDKVVARAS